MYELSQLPSGLRVITAPTDATAAITVLVLAGAGSRYEEPAERGISHFLEHMFFKGGKKYKTTKDVAAAIDGVGGEFNAFTGKEYAGYYVKVTAEHADLACDVLGDMLQHASFPQEEIEKERGVIMEEERMYQDTPMYRAGWDFELLLYGDQPLGWDTIGTEEVIRRVGQRDFQDHKDRLYTPDNMVVAFAGSITHKKAVALAEKAFGPIGGKKQRNFPAFTSYGKDQLYLRSKQTEQAHLVLGVPGLAHGHKDRFAQKLLTIVLGGTMSSRMFLNIREARGLCYYIRTEDDTYLDAGSVSTSAGVDQSRLAEAITAILEEYRVCVEKGVNEEELHRAKEYIKGKSVLGLEDSEERAHFVGKQALLYKEILDLEAYLKCIDAVTKKQVDTLAKKLLLPSEMRLVVIGSEKDEKKLRELLK